MPLYGPGGIGASSGGSSTASRRRMPTGAVSETFNRLGAAPTTVTPSGNFQRALGALIDLPSGIAITSMHWNAGDTGITAGNMTNMFAVLLDSSRVVLAVGTEIGGAGATISANAQVDMPISYTPGSDIAAYAMIACNGTVSTYMGTSSARTQIANLPPITQGVSSTAISGGPGTVTGTLGALTVSAGLPYIWLT